MRLIRADWIVIIAMIFYMGTLFATNFYINYKSDIAQQIHIEKEVVRVSEQNWFYRFLLGFNGMRYIWSIIVLPAFLVSVYYYCRVKYKDANPELLEAIAVFFFVSYLYNLLNDMSILLGTLIK